MSICVPIIHVITRQRPPRPNEAEAKEWGQKNSDRFLCHPFLCPFLQIHLRRNERGRINFIEFTTPAKNQDRGMGTKESDSPAPILLPFLPIHGGGFGELQGRWVVSVDAAFAQFVAGRSARAPSFLLLPGLGLRSGRDARGPGVSTSAAPSLTSLRLGRFTRPCWEVISIVFLLSFHSSHLRFRYARVLHLTSLRSVYLRYAPILHHSITPSHHHSLSPSLHHSAKFTRMISLSLRTSTDRSAKAGAVQTTGRPKASLVGSSRCVLAISV